LAKTYDFTLRLVIGSAHRYATRYQTKLAGTLSAPQYTCLVAFISAAAECLAALGPQPYNP